jgi:hypothetical protein
MSANRFSRSYRTGGSGQYGSFREKLQKFGRMGKITYFCKWLMTAEVRAIDFARQAFGHLAVRTGESE